MSRSAKSSTLAITMGDPRGVGPEVVVKALAGTRQQKRLLVVGDADTLTEVAQQLDLPAPDYVVHSEKAGGGVEYVRIAHEMAADGAIAGIVTGPIRKQRKSAVGHTELLSEWCGCEPTATMMMVAKKLKVSLATNHEPIAKVSRALTVEGILSTILRTHEVLQTQFNIPEPRIAVMGLNPHAGEGGKLGTEEKEIIKPAISRARRRKIVVEGPLPADSAFHLLVEGRWDAAVAMYHDQGLIPAKLFGFGNCVNVTLGLPYVRTSVDHGVAFDIAGRGIADEASMKTAIRLAKQLVKRRAT